MFGWLCWAASLLPLFLLCDALVVGNSHIGHSWLRLGSQDRHNTLRCASQLQDNNNNHHRFTITEQLQQLVALGDNSTLLSVNGYVLQKRTFGASLMFVDLLLVDDHHHHQVCQALLRREYFQGQCYNGYRRCFLPGTRLQVTGHAAPTRNPGEAVLLIQSIRLLDMPRQPQHIATLLKLTSQEEDSFPEFEVARACGFQTMEAWRQEQIIHNGNTKVWARHVYSRLAPLPQDVQVAIQRHSEVKSMSQRGRRTAAPHKWAVARDLLEGGLNHSETNIKTLPSVQDTLAFLDDNENNEDVSAFPLSVELTAGGWVQNRRRFDNDITVLFLVDKHPTMNDNKDESDAFRIDQSRLEVVLHPALMGAEPAERYGNLLAVGSKFAFQGVLCQHPNKSNGNVWVTRCWLRRASWRPHTVRYALDLMHEGRLSVQEGADGLGLLSVLECESLLEDTKDTTQRMWKATELSVRLQQQSETTSTKIAPEILQVLERYEATVVPKWPVVETTDIVVPKYHDAMSSNNRRDRSTGLLKRSVAGSKWRQKKRPQLEWMVHQIESIARAHPDFGTRTLHIVDIGGGKGALSNYLAERLGRHHSTTKGHSGSPLVQVHVVDIAQRAIANGAMRARRFELTNVQYKLADASQEELFQDHTVDIVVALHACGHLSDVALAHAVQQRASFVICPCCFNSNPSLRIPNRKNGGGSEAVEDFLGLPFADWSALKRVAEIQDNSALATRGIHAICAIRAMAAAQTNTYKSVAIASFLMQWSTRNLCLIGRS